MNGITVLVVDKLAKAVYLDMTYKVDKELREQMYIHNNQSSSFNIASQSAFKEYYKNNLI
jgi:hypothetical protein